MLLGLSLIYKMLSKWASVKILGTNQLHFRTKLIPLYWRGFKFQEN